MNLLALLNFNKMTKSSASASTSIIEEPKECQNTDALEVKKQYTEEELAAIILKELGVSDVIISNPTVIYQLKRVIKRRLMDYIHFDEIKTDSFGNP
ncbi:MAG: hypothetical protein K2J20_05435 [Bacilli bacterium]|nr:hypothetical protein [Bacilli bacterium]